VENSLKLEYNQRAETNSAMSLPRPMNMHVGDWLWRAALRGGISDK
jgi:hypothetical protein